MTRDQIEAYYANRELFERGEISLQFWNTFCTVVLENIMEENKDVLERLKDR